jgi:hypothetical protein
MHPDQRADWAMQDRGTLEYNKKALREQVFNKKQLQKLIEIVKTISE